MSSLRGEILFSDWSFDLDFAGVNSIFHGFNISPKKCFGIKSSLAAAFLKIAMLFQKKVCLMKDAGDEYLFKLNSLKACCLLRAGLFTVIYA